MYGDFNLSFIAVSPDAFCFVFRGNIPGSRINDGGVLCDYLPPVPAHGTGFHRFVFSLLKQTGKLDLRSHVCIDGRYD